MKTGVNSALDLHSIIFIDKSYKMRFVRSSHSLSVRNNFHGKALRACGSMAMEFAKMLIISFCRSLTNVKYNSFAILICYFR